MSLRALTLIVLMATWLVPANGYSCLRDSSGVAAHRHEQGPQSHSHAHEELTHAHVSQDLGLRHDPVAVETGADFSAGIPENASHEMSSCCESGRNPSVAEAAVKSAEPQPESASAIVQLFIATVPPDARRATAAQVQRQQPPPLPYEKNRRPLLI